ncbi:type II toxin-antitoxin system VapC family toxin [Salinarimonas chemoclinalis]|uniref:type II toxin-antitoxin system VapC family toxin n=1 Tax=Salinarimonas chemoclinalis TaxID=3241599 RepID=UPI003557FF84
MSFDRRRLYVDTNVFIELIAREGETSDALGRLFDAVEAKRLSACTSELTLAEILVRPKREGDVALSRTYLDLLVFSRLVELLPVDRAVLMETADYRAAAKQEAVAAPDRRNFLPDAIHVVTAIRAGCGTFLARDGRIRLPVGIDGLRPDPPALASFLTETP